MEFNNNGRRINEISYADYLYKEISVDNEMQMQRMIDNIQHAK